MAKRFYTCIVVREASSRLHKLRIPERALYALAIFGVASLLVVVALSFSYAGMAVKASDYDQLQSENIDLKIKTTDLQLSTSKLTSKISDLESLSQKLTKAIENDPAFKAATKPNTVPAGGSRTDVSTTQLIDDENLDASVGQLKDRARGLESQYDLLNQLIDKRHAMYDVTPSIWPIHGNIASPFGTRLDPFDSSREVHMGLDIVAPVGSPIKATAAGIVRVAQRESDYGNLIVIDHTNGLTTRYGHLQSFAVHVGQQVTKGQVIGRVGMTGRTTGPHLHYEVRLNDRATNPRRYLTGS